MYPDDMRLLTLEGKSQYMIPTADVAILESLLGRRRPPVDYDIKPLPLPQDPLAAERKVEVEDAVSRMPYDDGDALPEGQYVVDKGRLLRTGPAEAKVGWHGTSALTDTALDLELRAPRADGREHLRDVPAIYTTPDPLTAQNIAFDRWRRERDDGRGNERRTQIYEVAIVPSETVELGDCKDAPAAEEAIELGADVLECPDWVTKGGRAVPEMVVLNDDVHHTVRALQIDEIPNRDVSDAVEKTEQALRADPRVSDLVKRPRGMPRHTRFNALPAKPRKRKARKPRRHPFLRNGR